MDTTSISFLEPFLIHPDLLTWSPGSAAPDLVKRTIDVFTILRDDPAALRDETIRDMVWDKDSQIKENKERHFEHITDVGEMYRQLVDTLGSRYPQLDLPEPQVARAWGLVHDLSAIYARYDGTYKQDDKELTLYFHARHLGVETIARHVAMHGAYWEILQMIHLGEGFSRVSLYADWKQTLANKQSPYAFEKLQKEFAGFLEGKGNLPLILLTTVDYLENGKPTVDLSTFDTDFCHRTNDIKRRYYDEPLAASRPVSAFGYALIEKGGLERALRYKRIVKDLVEGRIDDCTAFPNFLKPVREAS